ncbi:hypothetical protein [Plantactinospora sp. GCM10030261]|uniref:hypothetical protein n=1 Tax=Plantactinospora sp. GCM10030261 TaxID=3273420 RepID=UPI003617113C
MTDLYPTGDDDRTAPGRGTGVTDERELARRTAAAHTAASRDVEAFLRRLPEVPSPGDVAEFGALVAREELLRAERQEATDAAGLPIPSVGRP